MQDAVRAAEELLRQQAAREDAQKSEEKPKTEPTEWPRVLYCMMPILSGEEGASYREYHPILREPKNSLVRQYQKLFKFEKVNLTFSDDALKAVAEMASTRKAGARGLRTILENVMLDIMYEIPSRDDIKALEITEDIIRGLCPAIEDEDKVPASG